MFQRGLLVLTVALLAGIAPLAQALECVMHAAPTLRNHAHAAHHETEHGETTKHAKMAVAECFDLPALTVAAASKVPSPQLQATVIAHPPFWSLLATSILPDTRNCYDPPPNPYLAALQPDLIVTTARRRI